MGAGGCDGRRQAGRWWDAGVPTATIIPHRKSDMNERCHDAVFLSAVNFMRVHLEGSERRGVVDMGRCTDPELQLILKRCSRFVAIIMTKEGVRFLRLADSSSMSSLLLLLLLRLQFCGGAEFNLVSLERVTERRQTDRHAGSITAGFVCTYTRPSQVKLPLRLVHRQFYQNTGGGLVAVMVVRSRGPEGVGAYIPGPVGCLHPGPKFRDVSGM